MKEDDLNRKWNIHKVVQQAIESAHTEPSPETRERLKSLEVNQSNFMDKLETSIQDNKEAHESLVKMITGIDTKLDKALERKADIWVEKAVSWAGYTVVGAVLLALMYLVIK